MNEQKLNDEEFRMWLDGSPYRMAAREPVVALLLSHYMGTPPKKPRSTKKRWTVLEFQPFGIAINTNGIVVVRGFRPSRFTIWIHPSGHPGTTTTNELSVDQVANEHFIRLLAAVTDQLRAWADQGNGRTRKLPMGSFHLLRDAREVLESRSGLFTNNRALYDYCFRIPSNKWPF